MGTIEATSTKHRMVPSAELARRCVALLLARRFHSDRRRFVYRRFQRLASTKLGIDSGLERCRDLLVSDFGLHRHKHENG